MRFLGDGRVVVVRGRGDSGGGLVELSVAGGVGPPVRVVLESGVMLRALGVFEFAGGGLARSGRGFAGVQSFGCGRFPGTAHSALDNDSARRRHYRSPHCAGSEPLTFTGKPDARRFPGKLLPGNPKDDYSEIVFDFKRNRIETS